MLGLIAGHFQKSRLCFLYSHSHKNIGWLSWPAIIFSYSLSSHDQEELKLVY